MIPWVRRFQKAVRHRPTLWGLHNYLDANRMRSTGTRKLLAAVKGRVWITETGGLVRRKHYRAQIAFPESADHAGKVTRFILQFADSHARIRRVYIYQWNANSLFQTWDSGLIDPFGQRRPAFVELAHHFGRNPARAPADPPFVVTTAPPPPRRPRRPPACCRDESPPPAGARRPRRRGKARPAAALAAAAAVTTAA